MHHYLTEIEKTIMQYEGGAHYTNDPNDSGGETKFGISKRANPDVDIPNLTLDLAIAIAKQRYWEPLHIDQYNFAPFRWKLFDIGWNQGVATAQTFMQHLTNSPDTIEAVWELAAMQMKRYANLVVAKPSNLAYLRGWTNRAMDTGEDL